MTIREAIWPWLRAQRGSVGDMLEKEMDAQVTFPRMCRRQSATAGRTNAGTAASKQIEWKSVACWEPRHDNSGAGSTPHGWALLYLAAALTYLVAG